MECLITKLKGNVDDNSLSRLGELRIKVNKVETPVSKTQGFTFIFNKDAKIEIVGNGYFTNQSLTANTGKTMQITANKATSVYVSNGDFDIALLDKYSLVHLSFNPDEETGISASQTDNRSLNIDDLKYSKALTYLYIPSTQVVGDLSSLQNLTELQYIVLPYTQITGDLSSLSKLTKLETINCASVNIRGDLFSLQNLTELQSLTLSKTQITGDLSSLSKLTKLETLTLNEVYNLTGFSSLSKLTDLRTLNLSGIEANIEVLKDIPYLGQFALKESLSTGDLAVMPDTCFFASFYAAKSGTRLSWSTRTPSARIIAIEGSPVIDNVDKMLQDMAQCQSFTAGSESWFKIIAVGGSRTSASDDAVSTLQEKGYTIKIAKA